MNDMCFQRLTISLAVLGCSRSRSVKAMFIVILLAHFLCGCGESEFAEPIKGFVCQPRHEVIGSYLLSSDIADGSCDPIKDATIELAFDKNGKLLIEGFAARSDANGRYTIPTKGIPRSPTERGKDYYIIIRKDGFEPIIRKLGIGSRSQYLRNTAVLMPIKKE
jgi:hypothetical protein